MSRYIGCRVSYPCAGCGRQITLSKKCVEVGDKVYCPQCAQQGLHMDAAIVPPAESDSKSDIVSVGKVDPQPRQ